MSRQGDHRSLLDDLHAPECDGREYSVCRPLVDAEDGGVVVVFSEWCGECGAADWEVV